MTAISTRIRPIPAWKNGPQGVSFLAGRAVSVAVVSDYAVWAGFFRFSRKIAEFSL
jgi:hypothetical protein